MKKNFILCMVGLFSLTTFAKDKTFTEQLVAIYNQTNEEQLELQRLNPKKELLDSMKRVAREQKGEELLETQKQIKEISNWKDLCIVGGSGLNGESGTEYKQKLDKLFSGYEELLMIKKDNFGGKIIGKLKKDKIEEFIIWLDLSFAPLGIPDFFSTFFDTNSLINIVYNKPVPLAEWLVNFDDSDNDSSEKDDALLDVFLKNMGISYGSESSFEMGRRLEDDESKDWEVQKKENLFGLYDADGNEILPPEYDEIKHYHGFLPADSSMTMYILGFELTKNGKKGYANSQGKIIIPPKYDEVKHFEIGASRYVCLFWKGKQGLASEINGKLIVPIEYDAIIWRGDYLELQKDGRPVNKIGWNQETDQIEGSIMPH
jgi:hypothetical protein